MSSNKKRLYEYYSRQIKEPYESTKMLLSFISEHNIVKDGNTILDIGCGAGAVTHCLARHYNNVNWVGLDYNRDIIDIGKNILRENNLGNLKLDYADWFNLPESEIGRYNGIINIHTLCCFKDCKDALLKLTDLKPQWIFIKSLFYDGPLDVLIHIRNYVTKNRNDGPDGDFNIFSLPRVESIFKDAGYHFFLVMPFNIDIDLPKSSDGGRRTYTIRLGDNSRAQFSGPVYLPWYFMLASKKPV